MTSSAARSLERWTAAWIRKRQGTDPADVTLERRRIYILPTRFGVVFGIMAFAMLLGSLNYGASLGFTLTFLLAGLELVVMHHCHHNLLGTRVRFLGAAPVFAGERAEFRMALGNAANAPRYDLELAYGRYIAGPVDVAGSGTSVLSIPFDTGKRGYAKLERFAVASRHPGRLFRTWTWVHMDAECLVYPRPAPPGRPLPIGQGGAMAGRPGSGDEDFAGLRAAVAGDPPQRIAWKAYARNDVLLLKQFAGGERAPAWLDWNALADLGAEDRLSQLTRWCLDADAQGRSFGLRLPTVMLPIGTGRLHLQRCLSALATYEVAP